MRVIFLLYVLCFIVKCLEDQNALRDNYCCNKVTDDFGYCENASILTISCYNYSNKISCSGSSQLVQVTGSDVTRIVCTEFAAPNVANITIGNYSTDTQCNHCMNTSCSGNGLYCNTMELSGSTCDTTSLCYCNEQRYKQELKYLYMGSWVSATKVEVKCNRIIKVEVIDRTPPLVVYTKKRTEMIDCRPKFENNKIVNVQNCEEHYLMYVYDSKVNMHELSNLNHNIFNESDLNWMKLFGIKMEFRVINTQNELMYKFNVKYDNELFKCEKLTKCYQDHFTSEVVGCLSELCIRFSPRDYEGKWSTKNDKDLAVLFYPIHNIVSIPSDYNGVKMYLKDIKDWKSFGFADTDNKKRFENQSPNSNRVTILPAAPPTYTVNWNQPTFNIFGANHNNTVVVLNKEEYKLELMMTTNNLVVTIPIVWFHKVGVITVKVYTGVNLYFTGSYNTIELDVCLEPYKCWTCEPVRRFHCADTFWQIIMITVFIAALISIIAAMISVVKYIMNCCGGMQIPSFTVVPSPAIISMLFFFCVITPANALSPEFEDSVNKASSFLALIIKYGQWLIVYYIAEEVIKKIFSLLFQGDDFHRNPNRLADWRDFIPNKKVLIFLLFLILVPKASTTTIQCDSSIQISTNEIECLRSQTIETCIVNAQVVVTLSYPGIKVCYLITNNDGNAALGTITVQYIQSNLNAQSVMKFWTCNYEVQTCSTTPCSQDGGCNGNRNCDRFLNTSGNDRITAWDMLSGSCALYPGQTTCMSSCGCAGCGCFYCDSACTYGRWGLKPGNSGPVAAKGFGPFSRYPTIKTCFVNLAGLENCTTQTIRDPGPQSFSENFTISVLGTLAVSNIVMPKNGIVTHPATGLTYFSDTCDQNVPCNGGIGDVQGATQSSIQNPTPTSFIFLPNYFLPSINGHTMTFTGPSSGYDRQRPSFLTRQLPFFSNSITWAYSSNGDVIGAEMNPGVLVVSLNTRNITFKRVMNEICPKLSIISTKGEYSSSTGGYFTVLGSSDCLPGSCILTNAGTDIGLVTTSLQLNNTASTMKIFFTSSQKNIAGVITCKAGAHTATFPYDFALDEPTIILVDGNTTGHQNSLGNLWDGWSVPTRAGFTIGMIFLIGLIIVGCFLCVFLIWKYDVGQGIGAKAAGYLNVNTHGSAAIPASIDLNEALIPKDDTELELDEAY